MIENEKKVIIVAGAMGYIGKAVVRELDKQNSIVALIYCKSPVHEVKEFMGELQNANHKAYQCDISCEEDVRVVFSTIENELGPLSCIIDASGHPPVRKKIIDVSFDEVKNYIETSFHSSYVFLTESAKFLKEKKSGTIIGVTTVGVLKTEAVKSMGVYILAKYAMQGLLALLHEELSTYGVRVFSVAPGFLSGGMNSSLPKAFFDIFLSKTETKKMTAVEDVATTICNLCKEKETRGVFTVPVAHEYKSL